MTIPQEVRKLNGGQLVELFELDSTSIAGGTVLRWHNGVNELGGDVVWGGLTYARFPIDAGGFAMSGNGTLPRPTLRVANTAGVIGALSRTLEDFIGSKVTRRRTFLKYLDAVNFAGGNPTADANVAFVNDVWYVDRKAAENGVFMEFELAAAHDVAGVRLPRRQCIQNTCTWTYRSAECGYAGGAVATRLDVATTDPALDDCGKRLASCELRFGVYGELPFGGFPGVGLIR